MLEETPQPQKSPACARPWHDDRGQENYLHNLQLLFNPTPRAKCQAIVLQKCRVMTRVVKFLIQAFSIQAQKNTIKTWLIFWQSSWGSASTLSSAWAGMSLHYPVPLILIRPVSFQNKNQPFCSLHRKQGLGNLFLSPLYFKTYLQRLAHRQQAQLHFEMCADWQEYKQNMDSWIFPQLLSKPRSL